MLKGLGRLRMIEYLLKRRIHTLSLADLLHRAAVVPCVGGGSLLRAQDERLYCGKIRQSLVTLRVPENCVEQGEGWPRREEVVHVRVPGTIEAGDERQPS